MNDYLFSQSALILPGFVTASLCYIFLRDYRRFLNNRRLLFVALCIAVPLLVTEIVLVHHNGGFQNTPAVSYYTVVLFDVVIALTVVFSAKQWRRWLFGVLASCSLAVLTALVVNSFYQYFPSLSSIFGNANHGQQTTVLSHDSHTLEQPSLEQQLFNYGTKQGVVTAANIVGSVSKLNARPGYIYTPPAYYDASFANAKFPVLLLLTGTPGNPSSWLQSNLFINTMNSFAAQHNGITPIVAIVDHSGSFSNDTECLNSSHGNAETYLTVDVPNYLKTHYRVLDSASNWGIAGFSEGGMCAAMLSLTHQNVFRHFLDMSGDPYPYLDDRSQTLPVLFNGSETALQHHNIDWLIEHQPINPDFTSQFAIGADDRKTLVAEMHFTYRQSIKRHIPGSFEVMQDQGHTFGFWSKAYDDNLPLLSYYLGATTCQISCTISNK